MDLSHSKSSPGFTKDKTKTENHATQLDDGIPQWPNRSYEVQRKYKFSQTVKLPKDLYFVKNSKTMNDNSKRTNNCLFVDQFYV